MNRRKHRARGRDVSGIVLLDKPYGMTSNAALQEVKRIFNARKAGHTGSLDPLATGLLPVCLGEATKISSFLLDADKYYHTVCRLGVKTTTADAEGEVVQTRPVEGVDEKMVETVLEQFRGEIEQVPPMYSALKHKGQPLYKLARQGIEVEREPRSVRVYELALLGLGSEEMVLSAHCSRGTYIRTLVEDIGEVLGCGAHIIELRRTGVGPYHDASRWHSLESLAELRETGLAALDAVVLPMESALEQMPAVMLTEDSAFYVRRGQPVIVPHAPTEGWVRLYAGNERFLGMGEVLDDGRVAPRRLMSLT